MLFFFSFAFSAIDSCHGEFRLLNLFHAYLYLFYIIGLRLLRYFEGPKSRALDGKLNRCTQQYSSSTTQIVSFQKKIKQKKRRKNKDLNQRISLSSFQLDLFVAIFFPGFRSGSFRILDNHNHKENKRKQTTKKNMADDTVCPIHPFFSRPEERQLFRKKEKSQNSFTFLFRL